MRRTKATNWNFLYFVSILGILIFHIFTLLCFSVKSQEIAKSTNASPIHMVLPKRARENAPVLPLAGIRTKRSPFIVAFQVTRPPGLFQISMKKPVIMGVMSNMTSMLLGSELARMLSRGISNSGFLLPLNVTSATSNSTKKS